MAERPLDDVRPSQCVVALARALAHASGARPRTSKEPPLALPSPLAPRALLSTAAVAPSPSPPSPPSPPASRLQLDDDNGRRGGGASHGRSAGSTPTSPARGGAVGARTIATTNERWRGVRVAAARGRPSSPVGPARRRRATRARRQVGTRIGRRLGGESAAGRWRRPGDVASFLSSRSLLSRARHEGICSRPLARPSADGQWFREHVDARWAT